MKNEKLGRPLLYAGGVIGHFGFNLMTLPLITINRPGFGDALIAGLVVTVPNWFVWMLCWGIRIRVSVTRLLVPNFFWRHEIPWPAVEEVKISRGLSIGVRSRGHGRLVVQSMHFGPSLLGDITGYPSHRRAVRRLEELRLAHQEEPASEGVGEYRDRFVVPWRSFLVMLILVEAAVLGLRSLVS
jgi:hypothetical protein